MNDPRRLRDRLAVGGPALVIAMAIVAVLVAVGVSVLAAADTWRRQPPSSDAWLTFTGAALGGAVAVLGAFLVGRWTAGHEATLALSNAMAVWTKERAAQEADAEASRKRTEAVSFRFALVELLDECRHWQAADPHRGLSVAQRLAGARLDLGSMRGVLDLVDLPPELLRYLLWSRWYLHLLNEGFQQSLSAAAAHISGATVDRNKWWAVIDRLQVIACLLIAEAKRRGISEIAIAFERDPWFVPFPGEVREREITESQHPARFGAPPWPLDEAYATCSPARRDHIAHDAVAQRFSS